MSTTQNFGLEYFSSEGRMSDRNYKFSDRDRRTIDALLWTLVNHDHRAVSVATLTGPLQYPSLTTATTGGTIPAGQTLHYKISYVDQFGNETEASPAISESTEDPLPSPPVMSISGETTGGALAPGIYRYALSYYQSGIGETRATNIATINVPTGTNTNKNTITLDTLPTGASGWKVYRRGPTDASFFLLDTITSGPTYVDDGTDLNLDCTTVRPNINTSNSANKITITINPLDLPLDSRVASWRLYRSSTVGSFGPSSLLATVVETTTEGGTDLVTSFVDIGGSTFPGSPLFQSVMPPSIPQLDASDVFVDGRRLPAALAPQGVHTHCTFLPGTLAAKTYNQFVAPEDILAERLDLYYSGANPTGMDSSNYLTLRVSDDASGNAVQAIYTDASELNEIQNVYNNATSGTFTLSDGVDTTSAIAYNATALTLETRLEADITAITDVTVSGAGLSSDPWVIQWVDPGSTNISYTLIADDTNLVGGTSTVSVAQNGSDGGTFTLSDGTSTTSAIAYDAAAATIGTRLEADITAYTDVSVTGTGTESDPWLVEFVNPGSQEVPLMLIDDALLNGIGFVSHETEGHGATRVDLVIDSNTAAHSWASSSTDFGEVQAEDAFGDGSNVSDAYATNDVAVELLINGDKRWWSVILDAGDYTGIFYVSADVGDTYVASVQDWSSAAKAQGTLTMDTMPSDGDTYKIDTKTYRFQTALTDVNGNVAIGGSLAQARLNLVAAMDLSGVAGTDYAASMTAHTSVDAAAFVGNDCVLTAKMSGTAGNSIATTETFTAGTNVFDGTTLGTTTAGTDGSVVSSQTVSDGTNYLPVHAINFTGSGEWRLYVEKTAGSGAVRVDKFEYILRNPTLHKGSTVTIEVLQTGSPTTNGDDAQVTLWY